jgi:hypothetical protein
LNGLSANPAPAAPSDIVNANMRAVTNNVTRFLIVMAFHLLSLSPKTKPEAKAKTGPPLPKR